MTVARNQRTSPLSSAPDSAGPLSRDGVCLSADFRRGAVVVVATGELDAFNAHHLAEYTDRVLSAGRPYVLDLSGLDFLGAQGIRTLAGIGESCRRAGVDWALVPSHAVTRLLVICGQDAPLPAVSSIDQALQRVTGPAQRTKTLLQLVSESR